MADAIRYRSWSPWPILTVGIGFNHISDEGAKHLFEALEPWWDKKTLTWKGVVCPTAIMLWGESSLHAFPM